MMVVGGYFFDSCMWVYFPEKHAVTRDMSVSGAFGKGLCVA